MSELSSSQAGTVIAHYGIAVAVRFDDGQETRLPLKRSQAVVVGDRVEVQGEGFRALPSAGVLRRRDSHGRVRSVAAHLDLLGIVVAPIPISPVGFIDRGLVAARTANLEARILINKSDLPGAEALYADLSDRYSDLVEIDLISAHTQKGLKEICSWLSEGRRGVFVGTSGVGKSSLLNALLPDLDLDVGEINEVSGLGRHVTSVATLHSLESGGELIDTPGFRDFGPVAVSSGELATYFPGFEAALEYRCHFRNCLHVSEPGCVVLQALAEGRIQEERHAAYLSLLKDLQQAESDPLPK